MRQGRASFAVNTEKAGLLIELARGAGSRTALAVLFRAICWRWLCYV